jgi:predicted 3-demethylubiquinone-9 3-methyltransferase (glyoxalase superfamily)
MHMGERPVTQKITTTLMFVGKQAGRAEEAIKHYVSIFKNASIGGVMRYGKGEEPDKEGTLKHAGFELEGEEFAAMDSALDHKFSFNEAISLLVSCEDQKEIDYYWNKLTAGGEEGVCGWLKDRFGFSWQVTPKVLDRMLLDPDKARASRVMLAFLKMKKLDIAKLKEAYEG